MGRVKIAGLLASGVFAFFSCCASAQFKITTNPDTGEWTPAFTSTEPMRFDHPKFHVIGQPEGNGFSRRGLFMFLIGSQGDAWNYDTCHSVNWVIDGTPMASGETNWEGKPLDGAVMETIFQMADYSDLEKMSGARSIEYRVCNDAFVLTDSDIAGIRSVVKALSEGPGASE